MNNREKWIVAVILTLWIVAIALTIYDENSRIPTCFKDNGTPIPCETFYALHHR